METTRLRRTRTARSLLLYLGLNVLVSAATTLAVLFAWDFFTGRDLIDTVIVPGMAQSAGQPVQGSAATADGAAASGAGAAPAGTTEPQATRPALPPLDQEVIQITLAAGAGDIDQEVLTLKRVGEGDLHMAGWKLYDEGGNSYIFPDSPELVLFAGGAVRVFSKVGSDTPTEIYWNRSEPVYEATELITLEDPQGNVRATYRVP